MATSQIPRRFLPSNAVLQSFEAAARHQSFTLAAEELHLTQSAISRQVKELESAVGVALFERVGRGVTLTDAGVRLAKDLAIDLESIRRSMMRAVSAGQMGAALRVACLPGFATRWLIPRLPEFFQQHPNVQVSMSTRVRPFDLIGEQFDLAIHFGAPDWPGTDMAFLCAEELLPVATPQLAETLAFSSIADLSRAPLLHLTTRPYGWQAYFEHVGLGADHPAKAGTYFDQFTLLIAAANASLGVGLLPRYLIEEELAQGRLVALAEAGMKTDNGYYLVTPPQRENAHVAALCAWMHGCVADRT